MQEEKQASNDPRQEVALERYRMIAPLLEPGVEKAEMAARRQEILSHGPTGHGRAMTERTLRRYLEAYRKEGFLGLYPKPRKDQGCPRALPEELLEQAMALKSELPQRSVRKIVEILEGEGRVKEGQAKASTLARHFARAGLMQLPKKPLKPGLRRFQREHCNDLWQADLKYGPYLPDPANPKKKSQTFLIAFLDDYSRLVTHAQFYLEQKRPALEDCFRKAMLKRGIPKNVFVDNGKLFISRWFRLACARVNIRHLTAAPYAPESKGKIERFMGTVDEFVAEMGVHGPKTLQELNENFWCWLEEGYNHRPHAALGKETPAAVFAGDRQKLRFVTAEELREAFLWEEDRKVDATGCFKLGGQLYEAGVEFAGTKVEIRYEPLDPQEIEIWQNGRKMGVARKLDLSRPRESPPERAGMSQAPDDLKAIAKAPGGSRYLEVLKTKESNRRKRRLGAISYRELGGGNHV